MLNEQVTYLIQFLPYPDTQPDMYSSAHVMGWNADDALQEFKSYYEGKGYVPQFITAVAHERWGVCATKPVSVRTLTTERYYV